MCVPCVYLVPVKVRKSQSLEPELQMAASGSLQEQQVLLAAESTLQALSIFFFETGSVTDPQADCFRYTASATKVGFRF